MPAKPASTELATLQSWAIEAEAAAGIARALAPTAFIPDTLRRWLPAERNAPKQLDYEATVATVTAALLTGQELGFRPMASLRVIDVIRQTPALRAVGLRALLLSHGHRIVVVETTETRAVVRGCRAGTEDWQTSTWTIDRAQKLGVYPGPPDGQWRRQPQNMLVARATAEVSRWISPDAMLGLPLIAEEVNAAGDLAELDGAPVAEPEPAATAPKPAARRRPAAPRVALPAAPPPSSSSSASPAEHLEPLDLAEPGEELPPGPPARNAPAVPRPRTPAEAEHLEPLEPRSVFPAHAEPPDLEPLEAEPVTKPQRARLHVLLRECELTDRNEALALISAWLGRGITTTNEMSITEAGLVIERLTALRDERGTGHADE